MLSKYLLNDMGSLVCTQGSTTIVVKGDSACQQVQDCLDQDENASALLEFTELFNSKGEKHGYVTLKHLGLPSESQELKTLVEGVLDGLNDGVLEIDDVLELADELRSEDISAYLDALKESDGLTPIMFNYVDKSEYRLAKNGTVYRALTHNVLGYVKTEENNVFKKLAQGVTCVSFLDNCKEDTLANVVESLLKTGKSEFVDVTEQGLLVLAKLQR